MTSEPTNPGHLVHEFHFIIDSVVGLPEGDKERIEDLVRVGEWQIALENLCTQLHEYDVKVSPDLLSKISELGRELKVAERYRNLLTS